MPKSELTKEKLLALMTILRRETDEEHHLSAQDILNLLRQQGISAERKSLYRDISILEEYGWDILHDRKGYYLASDTFELAELKLLVDTIQCSRFITEKKSYELIEKLESLTSRYRASQLRRQLFLVGRPKASNEQIYYNIDAIYEAINSNCEIQFDYMSRRPDGSRTKRGVYTASPYGLCWDSENYYLIAHREDKGRTHFRVDRMEHIRLLDTARKSPETYRDLNMAQYSKQVFGMFGGKTASVRLQFPNELADSAADRFGNDIMMIPQSDDTFTLTVDVDVSPVFFSWIFSFSGRVRILGPESVAEQYRQMCRSAAGI
ncbi:MAG: WYL domain-containing protein [Oscillospiraceae bacterium]|nr:WYL domain-containing protein [Oscillospiraceae bacterium]